MNNRKHIKKEHERAIVDNFLAYYNQANGTQFIVDSEPEPPEAIAKYCENYIWLEVTDAFWSDEYAKDLYSYATSGEEHIPVSPGPYLNMDEQFAQRFVQVLTTKLSKLSYKPYYEAYGLGILLIGMQNPFFNETTQKWMQSLRKATDSEDDLGYFGSVYLTDGSTFYPWPTV
jgi:hypothetical protein